jgi:hypothetical protein
VAESILWELDHPYEEAEPSPKRQRLGDTPPPSPDFGYNSPDYSPEWKSSDELEERSSSQSPPDWERLLEEAQYDVQLAETKTLEAKQALEDICTRYRSLRSRVLYLEGKLAVYKSLALINSYPAPSGPTCRVIVAAPPPPPPR